MNGHFFLPARPVVNATAPAFDFATGLTASSSIAAGQRVGRPEALATGRIHGSPGLILEIGTI